MSGCNVFKDRIERGEVVESELLAHVPVPKGKGNSVHEAFQIAEGFAEKAGFSWSSVGKAWELWDCSGHSRITVSFA